MNKFEKYREFGEMHHRRDKGNKVVLGLIIICFGVLLMVKKLGLLYFSWHLTWPIVLIIIGLAIGVKKRFRNNAWWILMLIGAANLVPTIHLFNDVYTRDLAIPALVIIGGLAIVFNSRKKKHCTPRPMETITSNESVLNIDVTFGGRKEIVTSKEFRGGHINTTFGGAEVNMIQADSTVQPMIIDMKVSFGGVELVVPSHWEIQNEIEPTFGSVEDHRTMNTANATGADKKVLILKGSCAFGSIEIKSY